MAEAHIGHGLLCTALEGGIGYWARAYDIAREQLTGDLAMDDFREYTAVTLVDHEEADDYATLDAAVERGEAKTHRVTADALRDYFLAAVETGDREKVDAVGFNRVTGWIVAYREDQDYPDLDAEDCDVLVQALVFGEVVYG